MSLVAEERAVDPTEARLDALYRAEREGLMRCVGRSAGADLAPDLVQEVFVRATASHQTGHLANPAGFLRRIARNLLIDRARHRATRGVQVPFDEEVDAPCAPTQELELHADDLRRQFETALDLLPEKTRRVFLMHRVDDLTYRQIHERLGISIATVEYHMMKALAQIAAVVDAGQ